MLFYITLSYPEPACAVIVGLLHLLPIVPLWKQNLKEGEKRERKKKKKEKKKKENKEQSQIIGYNLEGWARPILLLTFDTVFLVFCTFFSIPPVTVADLELSSWF